MKIIITILLLLFRFILEAAEPIKTEALWLVEQTPSAEEGLIELTMKKELTRDVEVLRKMSLMLADAKVLEDYSSSTLSLLLQFDKDGDPSSLIKITKDGVVVSESAKPFVVTRPGGKYYIDLRKLTKEPPRIRFSKQYRDEVDRLRKR